MCTYIVQDIYIQCEAEINIKFARFAYVLNKI